MAGSFWRRLPAAALRGFANACLPFATAAALSASKLLLGMYTSPRSSTGAAASRRPPSAASRRRSGTSFTVRMLAVTSSPVVPSPRVAARTRRPSSYVKAMDEPSILSSHTTGTMRPNASVTRSGSNDGKQHSSRSSGKSRSHTMVATSRERNAMSLLSTILSFCLPLRSSTCS